MASSIFSLVFFGPRLNRRASAFFGSNLAKGGDSSSGAYGLRSDRRLTSERPRVVKRGASNKRRRIDRDSASAAKTSSSVMESFRSPHKQRVTSQASSRCSSSGTTLPTYASGVTYGSPTPKSVA